MIRKLILITAMFMASSIWADRLSPNIYSPQAGKLVGLACVNKKPKSNDPNWWIISFKKKEVWEYYIDDYQKFNIYELKATDTELEWTSISYGRVINLNRASLEMHQWNAFNNDWFTCKIMSAPEVETRRLDLYSEKMNKNKL